MQFGVSESIAHWGRYRPNAPAVYHNEQVTSFGELNALINGLCHKLQAKNIDAKRIAIAVDSKIQFLIALISILRIGKSAIVLNTGLSDEAIQTIIERTEASALIHDKYNNKIHELLSSTNSRKILNISDVMRPDLLQASFNPPIIQQANDEWGVLFSSGTTGIPKGIERDHYSMVTELLGWCLELNINRHTKFYIGPPVFYTGGLVITLSTLLTGGSVFLNDYKDSNDSVEIWNDYQKVLASHQLLWAFFEPSMIRSFVKFAENLEKPPLKANTLLIMGSYISGNEKIKANAVLQSNIVESWGNTESLGTITDPEDLAKRPNSVGRPFLTDELYIVDDDCSVLEPFQQGKIAGGQEAGFSRYSNLPNETGHIKQGNLIISEDAGYMDDRNYFYVLGREQDQIFIEGKPVFLSEIESKLRQHDLVQECCVVVQSTDETNVKLMGVIVSNQTLEISEIEALERLNAFLLPDEQLAHIQFWKALPQVASGKINKDVVVQFINQKIIKDP
jgi:long-chain acyl-CoA synthetase